MAQTRNRNENGGRRNPSPAKALAEIDATKERLPSSIVELTPQERKLLKDPDWIDEDEADTIIAMRIERRQRHCTIPLEEYLKKRGIRVNYRLPFPTPHIAPSS
jgi:hypothetical protein